MTLFHLTLLSLFLASACKPEADTIFYRGKVLTLNDQFHIVQAIAIKDGKILATGTDIEILDYSGKHTKVIDLNNRTLIPGLIDAHAHPVAASQSELIAEIPNVHTIKDLLNWIKTQTASKKEGEWIIHPKFFITRMHDMRRMSIGELDSVSPHHPVFLNGSFGGMVNTKALQVSGLIKSEHEGILKSETGKPSGLIHSAVFKMLAIPKPRELSEDEAIKALQDLLHRYNKMGITSIFSGGGPVKEYDLYKKLQKKNELTVRIFHNIIFPVKSGFKDEEVVKLLDDLGMKTGDGDDMLKVGAFKVLLDGGVLTGTAYLREGWGTNAGKIYGITDPGYRGNISYTENDLRKLISIALKKGWKFSAHVTGGGAVDTLLSAFEKINDSAGITDKRFSIIHGNFFTDEAISKMHAMNIYADMQPAWYLKDADLLNEVLGSNRIATFHPYRKMIDKGIIINGGSDHMVKFDPDASINPYNPFLAMWSAITRKTERGSVFNADQAITRQEALRMYTINNAKASFEENSKGSLEPGKFADIAVLSHDILTCPADSIKSIHATLTMLNGKIVYNE